MEISSEHQSDLLAELNQVREQVMELNAHLDQASLSEFCKYLVPKLMSSLEKMSMAKTTSPGTQQQPGNPMLGAECPRSGIPSPKSENSNTEFRKDMPKKRKTMTKWINQVRLNEGATGGLEDGYSWRKYGQKIILGAKHPRGYFRCTHRYTQSCLATKQVQRSDDDHMVFNVTYHGTHTCLHRSPPATASPARHGQAQVQKPQQANQQQQLLQRFRTGLHVKTEGFMPEAFGVEDEASVFFSFGTSTMGSGPDAMLDNAFCSPSTPGNCFFGAQTCASFFSPTTSESTYFDGLHKLNSSESDLVSAANSASTSPLTDLSFPQPGPLDFDEDFGFFDASRFLS